ncbi:hypothetical protein V491_00663 [Pseudogymnoascus sp. VKM F-3775]|nr:hypothetical protein V491_00663 [Pseudogymnoascus sp. VKM F-3775]
MFSRALTEQKKRVALIMSRTARLSAVPVPKQGEEDSEFRTRSPQNAAPPFKRPRGGPPEDPSHETRVPAIISTSKPTDVNIGESSQLMAVVRPSASSLRAMSSATDHTASRDVAQKPCHGTKRKCNQLDGTTLRGAEAHEAAHPTDSDTSEAQQTPTVFALGPGIAQVSGHPKCANVKDRVRVLSQRLQTIQSSEQSKPFETTEPTQKSRGLPLIQPSKQANTDNGIGDGETLYQPSARMSSGASRAERCSWPQYVSPYTAISILADNPPPFLEPRWSPSLPSMMLPPIPISSPTHARGPPALLSPQPHPLRASSSSHGLRQYTMCGNRQTSLDLSGIRRRLPIGPSWKPHASFQRRLTSLLVSEPDDTVIAPARQVRFLYRRDLITLVPHVKHLGDKIINEYLHGLTDYRNARNSCNITLIGSMEPVARNLLKRLARFSTILVPIKIRTHWLLAVLYPGHERAKGRVEVFDSHPNWTKKAITASNVSQFLESRLGREFDPAYWILTSKQFSQPQQNDADSGLYLLANAISIALGVGMVRLDSHAQRMDLRWQIARELVTRSIVRGG